MPARWRWRMLIAQKLTRVVAMAAMVPSAAAAAAAAAEDRLWNACQTATARMLSPV